MCDVIRYDIIEESVFSTLSACHASLQVHVRR